MRIQRLQKHSIWITEQFIRPFHSPSKCTKSSFLLHIKWFSSNLLAVYICKLSHACHCAQMKISLSKDSQSINWPRPTLGKDLSIFQTPWTFYSGFTCCLLKERMQIRSGFFSTWLTLFWLLVARVEFQLIVRDFCMWLSVAEAVPCGNLSLS